MKMSVIKFPRTYSKTSRKRKFPFQFVNVKQEPTDDTPILSNPEPVHNPLDSESCSGCGEIFPVASEFKAHIVGCVGGSDISNRKSTSPPVIRKLDSSPSSIDLPPNDESVNICLSWHRDLDIKPYSLGDYDFEDNEEELEDGEERKWEEVPLVNGGPTAATLSLSATCSLPGGPEGAFNRLLQPHNRRNPAETGASSHEQETKFIRIMESSCLTNIMFDDPFDKVDLAGQRFECTRCGLEYSSVQKYAMHLWAHSSVMKPVDDTLCICTNCGVEFSNEQGWVDHVTATDCPGQQKRVFPCLICGVYIGKKGIWRNHLREHAGQKYEKQLATLRCDLCCKAFVGLPLLLAHKQIHINRRNGNS